MLELENPFDVYVKILGSGTVMFIQPGCMTCNPQLLVRLHDTGFLRTVDQNDVIVYGNPTAGQDLYPPLPKGWERPKIKGC